MRNKTIILSVTLLLLLSGVIGIWLYINRQTTKLLLSAEEVMTEYPDSALHILQTIRKPEHLIGENQALYALLLTQASYKNYIPVDNDSLIRLATDYYAEKKDNERKAWSYFYAAQVYRDTKDRKRALDYFQKAATATEGSTNYKLLALLYYHWGGLLQKEKPYEEGLSRLIKAKQYEELNKDTANLINTYGEIARSYIYKEDYKLAQTYLWKGIDLAQSIKNAKELSWLYQLLSIAYEMDKQFTKSLEYANISLLLNKNEAALKPTFSLKGSLFIELQQYDSARYYIEKSKRYENFYNKAGYHLEISKIEKGLGNYKEALKHHEIYSQYVDSIEISEKDNNLMELQKKYNYSIVQNENIQLKTKNQRRGIAILSIIVILLIAIFIAYYIYNKVKREKENIIYIKDALLDQSVRQIQQKTNELMQNKQTLQEKENELREYIQKEQGLKEDISSKEEKLQSLKQQQKELKEQIFKMNGVVKRIEEMNSLNSYQKKKAELMLSEKELDDLFSAINFCYDDFEKRLRAEYPNLTNHDIYMCCLLRMGVSNQNIAILLMSNEEALKKRKYRIKREKMNLARDGTSLEDHLKNY